MKVTCIFDVNSTCSDDVLEEVIQEIIDVYLNDIEFDVVDGSKEHLCRTSNMQTVYER